MASNRGSRARSKDNLNAQKGSGGSGMIDHLAHHNTGYPDLKSPRIGKFATNGPVPENPYSDKLPHISREGD